MVLGIDGRGLTGTRRGVARYASALLEALRAAHPEDRYVVLEPGAAGTSRAAAVSAGLLGRPRVDALLGRVDAVWAPAPRPLAVGPRTGLVLSVHDRSWEQRPGDFTPYERLWHGVARPRRLARRADVLLFDTAAVRDDVVPAWGLDPARARLAAPGVEPPAPAGPAPARPFFLWVGALEPRKAPEVLAVAFAAARAAGLSSELVVVGEGRMADVLDGPGVRRLGRVDDEALAALLPHARALVAPSHGEGYGLTPLEALAHGTPAIVSDLPVFAETLGGAALRVPAGDPRALAAALLRLEREPGLRAELAAAAPPRPEWEDAAAVLHRALHDAAEARR